MITNNDPEMEEGHSSTEIPEYLREANPGGALFIMDFKKYDDLKQMLDSNKDSLKLEAMKRIIGMVAKGRDASELFPAVVKNVVSKNIEVKKLVYVYLVRYAEEQQDLALLSISTFQRALKDPNQLIRASALRVLSSIRVPVIVPIMMLAIKDSVADMSPYVRKTAAHAIPKLYRMDPEQREDMINVIERLLSDKTTLVVGSAVAAFEEVCPERIDLIHKNYRKLCNLLVDVEEWGQVIIINMLTRYARSQFLDPNRGDVTDEPENRPFYDDDDEEEDQGEEKQKKSFTLDPDHRLLLRNTKSLLQSRNASVVMAVAQLFHHLAPKSEVNVVAKALIRLLRSHREVQSIVLNSIASMSTQRKGMFEPFLKSFFVRTSDATHIKLLKLEILTNLATETSISVILREFQTYIASQDKEFVAATIQAIGRCASTIQEVTDTCLNGLVALLSNRDPSVVAESVVVIKKLLQTQPSEHSDIIVHMAKLMDSITVSRARASILWLLGEYSDRVPNIAPDVLRKMAKSFTHEEDIVKLQTLNLAIKLYLTNPKQTKLLCQYVFNLAKYDQNYDIRDRARFMRQFIFPTGGVENGKLAKYAKKIFLATKPAPVLTSKFKDRDQFQLGSLSHYINSKAAGYHDLPDFPTSPPDPSVRNVESPPSWEERRIDTKKQEKKAKKPSFYSSDESSPVDESDESTDSVSESSELSYTGESESEEESEEMETDSGTETEELDKTDRRKKESGVKFRNKIEKSESEESESESKEDSTEASSEEPDSSVEEKPVSRRPEKEREKTPPKSNVGLLLDLDDIPPPLAAAVMTPSLGGFLTPSGALPATQTQAATIQPASPAYIPTATSELLNKISGRGLQVLYRFTRAPHLYSPKMISVELSFTNMDTEDMQDIRVGPKNIPSGMALHEFAPIGSLPVAATLSGTLGVDFNDTTQPVGFDILVGSRSHSVSLRCPLGELVRAVSMPESLFSVEQGKLRGMNETSERVALPSCHSSPEAVVQRVCETANVLQVTSTDTSALRFAGQTMSSKSLVLITVKILEGDKAHLMVNCEKMLVGSMLLKELKDNLVK